MSSRRTGRSRKPKQWHDDTSSRVEQRLSRRKRQEEAKRMISLALSAKARAGPPVVLALDRPTVSSRRSGSTLKSRGRSRKPSSTTPTRRVKSPKLDDQDTNDEDHLDTSETESTDDGDVAVVQDDVKSGVSSSSPPLRRPKSSSSSSHTRSNRSNESSGGDDRPSSRPRRRNARQSKLLRPPGAEGDSDDVLPGGEEKGVVAGESSSSSTPKRSKRKRSLPAKLRNASIPSAVHAQRHAAATWGARAKKRQARQLSRSGKRVGKRRKRVTRQNVPASADGGISPSPGGGGVHTEGGAGGGGTLGNAAKMMDVEGDRVDEAGRVDEAALNHIQIACQNGTLFHSLPNQVVCHILGMFDARTLHIIGAVEKLLRENSRRNDLWKALHEKEHGPCVSTTDIPWKIRYIMKARGVTSVDELPGYPLSSKSDSTAGVETPPSIIGNGYAEGMDHSGGEKEFLRILEASPPPILLFVKKDE